MKHTDYMMAASHKEKNEIREAEGKCCGRDAILRRQRVPPRESPIQMKSWKSWGNQLCRCYGAESQAGRKAKSLMGLEQNVKRVGGMDRRRVQKRNVRPERIRPCQLF